MGVKITPGQAPKVRCPVCKSLYKPEELKGKKACDRCAFAGDPQEDGEEWPLKKKF